MSKADFEYMLNKKIEAGTLYYTTFNGKFVCNRCNYRGAWTDTCRKFNKKIKKINQANGGFHHEPCQECLNYKLQQQDINYIRSCYNRKRGIK
jgi:hypothetical protein